MTMAEQQAQEVQQEPVLTEFVYAGQRVGSDGKRSYLWARVSEPDNLLWFSKPLVTASVGGVYHVWERRGEGNQTSVFSAGKRTPKYLRRFDASEDEKTYVAKWAAADEATKQELSLKARNAKAAKVEPMEDLLNRVSNIAQHLNRTERRALLSKLAEALWL